jgi:trigger factor
MSSSDSDLEVKVDPENSSEAEGGEEQQRLDLSVEIVSPSACQRHVTVTIPREDINRYFDRAFSDLMPAASVPGFRPGRAPRKLVESHFRKDVSNRVKGSLLLDSMTQVTESGDFSAISEPDFNFDAVEIPEDGPMVFEFDIEVRPDFDMPQWKGLKLERLTREFSSQDVDDHLSRVLERFATLEPTEDAAKLGDVVVVDARVTHEGRELCKMDEQSIRVRPTVLFVDATLPNFDSLMVGAKAGDKKTATTTISKDSDAEELQGKEVQIEFSVLDVKRMTLPEFNKEFLSKLGDFETEGDLRDAVKSNLERQLAYEQRQRIREQITDLLTEAANWELPPDMLRRQSRRELERAVMELRSSGFPEEQIQAHANLLRQNSLESTAKALKEHFILERIAEEENLEATDAEYDQEIMLMALQQGESPRRIRSRIEKRGLMDALRNQIVEGKAIERIVGEATFVEAPYEQPVATTTAVELALAGGDQQGDIPDAKYAGDQRELKQPIERE